MQIKETTIRPVELLILTRTTKKAQRIFHFLFWYINTFFQALKLVIFLPFLKHKTTIQRKLSDVIKLYKFKLKHDLVRPQAAKFKLLVVLSTTTTMNVGNRWHSTSGPNINAMRDFWDKTCSTVCPWWRVECVSFSNSKLLGSKMS